MKPAEASRSSPRFRSGLAILGFTGVMLLAHLAGPRFPIVSGDDGTYIALARSIASGTYRAINVPGEPIQNQYPPLLPLIMAPISHLPLGSMRFAMALLSLGAVVAALGISRTRDPRIGAIALLPFILSPFHGEYSTSVLTETLHVALAYGSLIRIERSERDRSGSPDWVLAIMLACSLYLRTAAVALVVAAIGRIAWTGHWRKAAFTAGFTALAVSPWWIWQAANSSSYVSDHVLMNDIYLASSGRISYSSLFLERMPHNLSRYVGRIVIDVLFPKLFTDIAPWTKWFPLKVIASAGVAAAIGIGLFRQVRARGAGPEIWYLAASAAMLLIHPVYADRYLYPVLPSLIGFLLLALPRARARIGFAVAWSIFLIGATIVHFAEPLDTEDCAYIEAVDWIAEKTDPEDVILARKPTTVWYHARRKSTGYPTTSDPEAWPRDFTHVIRDDYVIGVPAARLYVDPVVADTTRMREVFVSRFDSDVRIYRRIPPGSPIPESGPMATGNPIAYHEDVTR